MMRQKSQYMDQGEPGVDYDEPNLNPLICDICKQRFDSLDKLGEHQKIEHDMWSRIHKNRERYRSELNSKSLRHTAQASATRILGNFWPRWIPGFTLP